MQDAQNIDFQIEAKIDSLISESGQEQGVLVEQDIDNWLRFDYFSDGELIHAFAVWHSGGSPSSQVEQVIGVGPSTGPLYMRVTRTGDEWLFERSEDGTTWIANGSFTAAINVARTGVFVGNANINGTIPAHTATFDYFFNTGGSRDTRRWGDRGLGASSYGCSQRERARRSGRLAATVLLSGRDGPYGGA